MYVVGWFWVEAAAASSRSVPRTATSFELWNMKSSLTVVTAQLPFEPWGITEKQLEVCKPCNEFRRWGSRRRTWRRGGRGASAAAHVPALVSFLLTAPQ